ncbi:hypothetical protein N9A26_00075 [bacterium]|nr:hypothetical protein [bacterium]
MKKLLLILFLIPTFVLAEDFTLVCDGEMRTYRNNKPESVSQKTRVIDVKESAIRIDGEIYKTETSKSYDDEMGHTTSYRKNDKKILLKRTSFNKEQCYFAKITEELEINRISGILTSHYKIEDTCGKGTFLFVSNIKAKCEKKDRSF